MKSLVIIFSMFLALNVTAKTQNPSKNYSYINIEYVTLENEMFDLEQVLFEDLNAMTVNVEDLKVIEVEEEVEINFDTKKYLPTRFNAQKGMHDVNWENVELVEVEEDIELSFDTKKYLPQGFCPYIKRKSKTVVSL